MSDIMVDTINDLLACDSWDENLVCSDFVKEIPAYQSLDDSVLFGQARDLNDDIPLGSCGKL